MYFEIPTPSVLARGVRTHGPKVTAIANFRKATHMSLSRQQKQEKNEAEVTRGRIVLSSSSS